MSYVLVFKCISGIASKSITTKKYLLSEDCIYSEFILDHVMAWCHQTTSHYLNQCCPTSVMQYGIIRPPRISNKNFTHKDDNLLVKCLKSTILWDRKYSTYYLHPIDVASNWKLMLYNSIILTDILLILCWLNLASLASDKPLSEPMMGYC